MKGHGRVRQNWTSEIYNRQVNGKWKASTLRPLRGYLLSSLISSTSCLRKIFLGFSIDGNYVFSYSFKADCNVTNIELSAVYKYKLQVWKFSPNEKLRKLDSIPLFSGATIRSELFIELAQFSNDPTRLLVLAREADKFVGSTSPADNQSCTSSISYVSIVPLIQSHFYYCSCACEKTIDSGSFILSCSIICTTSHFTPLFYYFKLPDDNFCILNSGTHVYIINLNGNLLYDGSEDAKAKYLLDSAVVCSACKKNIPNCNVTVSSILDIELLLQGLCEQVCKTLKLTYIGFYDYESCILGMQGSDELELLFSVLIELSGTYSFWEATFTARIKLSDKSDSNQNFGGQLLEYRHSPLEPRISAQGWKRLNTVRRELSSVKIPEHRFSTARLLTNRPVLRRQSLPYLFDVERINAIMSNK